jgi:hypothetical protein
MAAKAAKAARRPATASTVGAVTSTSTVSAVTTMPSEPMVPGAAGFELQRRPGVAPPPLIRPPPTSAQVSATLRPDVGDEVFNEYIREKGHHLFAQAKKVWVDDCKTFTQTLDAWLPSNACPLPAYPAHPAGVDEYIAYAARLYTRQLEPVANPPLPPPPARTQAPVSGPTNSAAARGPPPPSQPSRPVVPKGTITLGANGRIPRKAPPKVSVPDVDMTDTGTDTQSKPAATARPTSTPKPKPYANYVSKHTKPKRKGNEWIPSSPSSDDDDEMDCNDFCTVVTRETSHKR